MPIGLEIMHWDERIGVEVLSCYPEDMVLAEKTLMQLYSQHEFTGEPGMVSMMAGSSNLASYYTGPDTAIYIVLVLTADEDGDMYEEGLVEISQQVTANLDPGALKALLPSLFQRLAVYPHLTNEQKLAILLQNEIKSNIISNTDTYIN